MTVYFESFSTNININFSSFPEMQVIFVVLLSMFVLLIVTFPMIYKLFVNKCKFVDSSRVNYVLKRGKDDKDLNLKRVQIYQWRSDALKSALYCEHALVHKSHL